MEEIRPADRQLTGSRAGTEFKWLRATLESASVRAETVLAIRRVFPATPAGESERLMGKNPKARVLLVHSPTEGARAFGEKPVYVRIVISRTLAPSTLGSVTVKTPARC